MSIHFDDDIAWAKPHTLELVERHALRKSPNGFRQSAMSPPFSLKIIGGKDAQKS